MTLTDRQRTDRLRKRLLELELWTVAAERPLEGWSLDGQAHAHGAPWPTREGVVTLGLDGIEVPEDWPLEETRLDVHLGGEGLLRIAYPDGGGEAFGLDPNHERFPVKGRRFDVAGRMRRPPPLRRPEPRRQPRAGAPDPARPRPRRVRAPGDPGRRRRARARRPRGRLADAHRGRGRPREARLAERHPRLRRAHRAERRVAADLGAARRSSTPPPPASPTSTARASRPRTPSSSTACAPCATATRRTARWR